LPIASIVKKGKFDMNRFEKIAFGLVLAAWAAPVLAGVSDVRTPAPIAGIGIGAVLLMGAGYTALKRRIGR
jgi:hypothetical protein